MSSVRMTKVLRKPDRSPTRPRHEGARPANGLRVTDYLHCVEKSVRGYFNPPPFFNYSGGFDDFNIYSAMTLHMPWQERLIFSTTNKQNRSNLNQLFPDFNEYRLKRDEKRHLLGEEYKALVSNSGQSLFVNIFICFPAFLLLMSTYLAVMEKLKSVSDPYSGVEKTLFTGLVVFSPLFFIYLSHLKWYFALCEKLIKMQDGKTKESRRILKLYRPFIKAITDFDTQRFDFSTPQKKNESFKALGVKESPKKSIA